MKILMLNPVHPETLHISGLRAWRFARELADSGHKVVLLAAPLLQQDCKPHSSFQDHDWSTPLLIQCVDKYADVSRGYSLPTPLRKLKTVWHLMLHGGEMHGWTVGAVHTARRFGGQFSPDVVWCTFGKMEAVIAARRIARHLRCPWVLDIKDNWELYVPRGIRHLMAWRTQGWSAVTANARFTALKARRWQRTEATLVYSGVDEAFYLRGPTNEGHDDVFLINLVGSLYFYEPLQALVSALEDWSAEAPDSLLGKLRLCYLGADGGKFSEAIQGRLQMFTVVNQGYQEMGVIAAACRRAALNVYIAHSGTFHHKLLELLACGRPALAVPRESDESRLLAAEINGTLLEAADSQTIVATIRNVYAEWIKRRDLQMAETPPDRRYSWSEQAKELERILLQVARNDGEAYGR